jgi:hypothetical protein
MFWIAVGVLWLIAIATLAGSLMLPEIVDLYLRDRYFVVVKAHLVVAILLLFILPLLTLTIWRLRSTNN